MDQTINNRLSQAARKRRRRSRRNSLPLSAITLLPLTSFDGAAHLEKGKMCSRLFKRETLPHVRAHMIKCVGPAGDYERLKTCQTAALNADAGEEGFDSDVLSKEALSQWTQPRFSPH